ncbi:MAG: hypothetical protein Q4G22_03220 [Paracoccus sp. (in: a-proteobacteria)]|uniref:hypothetical protein n=1 Tax=Paracoccus sp. TaxID=267 RepID=UPI0026E0BB2A|nr:hypothetical protein [Paracoccus sp. (in: a-proteobacteria)]MDO5630829.1 hypothetical protein [Paracoccus sp. (in: a-proteobacteria)]
MTCRSMRHMGAALLCFPRVFVLGDAIVFWFYPRCTIMPARGWLQRQTAAVPVRLLDLFFAALLTFGLAGAALSDDADEADLWLIADRLASVAGIDELTQTCPADVWKTRRGLWQSWVGDSTTWSWRRCRQDVAGCLDRCINNRNGSACLAAARVIERSDLEIAAQPRFDMARRQGFSLACALGSPSACTNRGASLRNARIRQDQLSQDRSEEFYSCLMRTFSIACSADNAWGCSMEGQAFQLGEGHPVDLKKATARFLRACSISATPEGEDTEVAPCRFARQRLELIAEGD